MRGNSHVRCEVGENLEITSKDYLSLSVLKSKKDLAAYVNNSTTPIPPKELEEIELE